MSEKDFNQDEGKKEKKSKKKDKNGKSNEPKLFRVEIILSQSIEEDFVTAFMKKDTGKMYTKLPMVMGRGVTDPKMGDAIWPQLNCMYIIICTGEQADVIKGIIADLHREYPNEGLACFKSKVKML